MPIATRDAIQRNLAKGFGAFLPLLGGSRSAGTVATAGSGFWNIAFCWNSVGTTLYSTLVGYPTPPATAQSQFVLEHFDGNGVASGSMEIGFAWLYTIGTVNLAATGDNLVHNAATFPVVRTQLGVAAQPLTLVPVVLITTATATTAPVFRLQTNAGAAGYVNQSGSSVVGAKTMTMPAAATVAGSGYLLRLEDGDTGVQDITNVEVTTAGSAGAATIFGMEVVGASHFFGTMGPGYSNALFGGLKLNDMRSAVATAGTVTAYLVSYVRKNTSFPTNADRMALLAVYNV